MTQISSFVKEEINIRQANDSDANSLALLVAERGFDYPTEISLVRERLADLIGAGDCILVAVYDSKIIGMALLHRTRFLHRAPDASYRWSFPKHFAVAASARVSSERQRRFSAIGAAGALR